MQVQAGRGQVGSQRVASMGWRIVPNHGQRLVVPCPKLSQEGSGGGGITVAIELHHLHLAGLQTHRRVVAGLLASARAGGVHQGRFPLQHPLAPQIPIRPKVGLVSEEYLGPSPSRRRRQSRILSHEGFPPHWVRLDQLLLGPLQHKPQPVQVVPATAPAQYQPEAFPHIPAHRLPVPVRQADARLRRQFPHRRLQLGLLLFVQRGGEPPVCSKDSALGPLSANAVAHWPMVWASLSNARAAAAAVQPCASSHSACQRSRSRGVGARYIRRRTSASLIRHRSSSAPISIMPNSNPHSNSFTDQLNYRQFYPTPMRVSPWLRFRREPLRLMLAPYSKKMDTASASVQCVAQWPQLTPLSLALVSEQKRLEFLLMRRRGSGYVKDVWANQKGYQCCSAQLGFSEMVSLTWLHGLVY